MKELFQLPNKLNHVFAWENRNKFHSGLSLHAIPQI